MHYSIWGTDTTLFPFLDMREEWNISMLMKWTANVMLSFLRNVLNIYQIFQYQRKVAFQSITTVEKIKKILHKWIIWMQTLFVTYEKVVLCKYAVNLWVQFINLMLKSMKSLILLVESVVVLIFQQSYLCSYSTLWLVIELVPSVHFCIVKFDLMQIQ